VEYELNELRISSDAELSNKRSEVQKLKEQLLEKDALLTQGTTKLDEAKHYAEKLQQQLESQQRYLIDVPTPEEHSKREKMNKELREEVLRMKAQMALLEKRLQETQKGRHSRDSLIETLERSGKELREKLLVEEVRIMTCRVLSIGRFSDLITCRRRMQFWCKGFGEMIS
jgi:hypothetical protein